MLHTTVCGRFQLIPKVLKCELQESTIAFVGNSYGLWNMIVQIIGFLGILFW